MGGKGVVVMLGGGRVFMCGGVFPFVREFNVVVCMSGFDMVCFNVCGCYSF